MQIQNYRIFFSFFQWLLSRTLECSTSIEDISCFTPIEVGLTTMRLSTLGCVCLDEFEVFIMWNSKFQHSLLFVWFEKGIFWGTKFRNFSSKRFQTVIVGIFRQARVNVSKMSNKPNFKSEISLNKCTLNETLECDTGSFVI